MANSPSFQLPGAKSAPDLFIIGGARCGSTSLHYYLNQHPGIFMCQPDKEPSFYCDVYGVKNPMEYASNFAGAKPGQLLGDASTPYLSCPASARLIHAANPSARIIAILRQPAERAYSLFLKMRSLGHETAADFETALKREEQIINDPPELRRDGYHYNYLYFNSGLYAAQLRRYFEFFPKEQTQIILFDELAADAEGVCENIVSWLGLDSMPEINPEPRNQAVQPRSPVFQHWLRRSLNPILKKIHLPWRGRLMVFLFGLNTSPGQPPKIAPNLRRQLTDRYAEDIRATAALLERDLSHWLA